MLTEYIEAAMRKAKFKLLDDEEGYFGSIPGLRGVWANADTAAACKKELRSALEDWILVGVRLGHSPVVAGINLNLRKAHVQKGCLPPFGPIDRRKLIQSLRKAGFTGPYSGTNHQFMVREQLRLTIPNSHRGDISMKLLSAILKEAGISREEWKQL